MQNIDVVKFEFKDRLLIYKKAIDTWGYVNQIEMAMEESIEFSLALRKELRHNNEKSFDNLIEEFADLEIMMETLELMYSNLRSKVDDQKNIKINRLLERIEKHEKK